MRAKQDKLTPTRRSELVLEKVRKNESKGNSRLSLRTSGFVLNAGLSVEELSCLPG